MRERGRKGRDEEVARRRERKRDKKRIGSVERD